MMKNPIRGWKIPGASILMLLTLALLFGCAQPVQNNYARQGVQLLEKGKLDAAYTAFEKAYQQNPNAAFNLNNMGYVQEMKYQNYQKAAALYQRAVEKAAAQHLRVVKSDIRGSQGQSLEAVARQNLMRVQQKLQQ